MKILIADDNAFYSCMLEAALKSWGYEVVSVRDGVEAWRVFQEPDHPRLALVDWMMPGMDGVELCRRIRATPATASVYVIMLTVKEGKENVISGLKAGADDYVLKPFHLEELQTRIGVGLRIVDLQASLADRVKELEQALSGAQKMEAVGRLAGGVAHDFNNLLTVVLSGTDCLCDLVQDEKVLDLLETIKGAAERGAGLTRQLLAFSRKAVLRLEVMDLNALVANLQKMLLRLIGEDVELVADLDPGLGCVRADRGQMEQVILNLAVNARDAMPAGGKLTIATRCVRLAGPERGVPPGDYALLAVRDTGCGMGDTVKAHLFEPFYTTKELHKGTGLGLATVHGIVLQTGGHIRVESEPGRGAEFLIYLPRTDQAADAPKSAPDRPARAGNRETVLLVEDEDSVRAIARRVLLKNRYTVLEARDGQDALRVSASWNEPIHLMVTDVVMPRTNGHQLAASLQPLRPDMKVLFMSGYTDDAMIRRHVAESGRPFLQKPFTPSGLAAKVREVLDN
jgi:signal transduction histidine kinase